MLFSYASSLSRDVPELATQVLRIQGVTPQACTAAAVGDLVERARQRLASTPESELPEIQAWRRAFARMGLRPTQYRCASEALLRRLRKEGELPRLHPLVDLCNAASVAYAIPVAVIDLGRVQGRLRVGPAAGAELYETFTGETEHPQPGEIIFADEAGRAHARRWCNRQSGHSAVTRHTADALIVAEALHATAGADTGLLIAGIEAALSTSWPQAQVSRMAVQQPS